MNLGALSSPEISSGRGLTTWSGLGSTKTGHEILVFSLSNVALCSALLYFPLFILYNTHNFTKQGYIMKCRPISRATSSLTFLKKNFNLFIILSNTSCLPHYPILFFSKFLRLVIIIFHGFLWSHWVLSPMFFSSFYFVKY